MNELKYFVAFKTNFYFYRNFFGILVEFILEFLFFLTFWLKPKFFAIWLYFKLQNCLLNTQKSLWLYFLCDLHYCFDTKILKQSLEEVLFVIWFFINIIQSNHKCHCCMLLQGLFYLGFNTFGIFLAYLHFNWDCYKANSQ